MQNTPDTTARRLAWGLACLCLLPMVASQAHGEAPGTLFLPSEVQLAGNGRHVFTTLSNEDLLIRASQMRDDELSPSQRAMNYQWLSEHSGAEDTIRGSKAVTKLVERHLKGYLEQRGGDAWIKDKLMPESRPDSFLKGVDYDLKLRSDKLVIGVTYEF